MKAEMIKGLETMYYWLKEYDYTLKNISRNCFLLIDNQEVNDDKMVSLSEVVAFLITELKEKSAICKSDGFDGFDSDISVLETFKSELDLILEV